MKRAAVLMIALLALPLAGAVAKTDIEDRPGYFDFGDISEFASGEEVVEINLERPLLAALAGFKTDDPELNDLLDGLELVRVHVFSFEPERADDLEARADNITGELEKMDWARMVEIKAQDSRVHVYAKTEENDESETKMAGLVVVALDADDDEAVFVNVVGQFDLSDIGKLDALEGIGEHLDIDFDGDGKTDISVEDED